MDNKEKKKSRFTHREETGLLRKRLLGYLNLENNEKDLSEMNCGASTSRDPVEPIAGSSDAAASVPGYEKVQLDSLEKCLFSWQMCAATDSEKSEDMDAPHEEEDNKYQIRSGWSRKLLTTENLLSKDFTFWGPDNPTILSKPKKESKIYNVKPPLCSPALCPTKLPQAFSRIPHLWGSEEDRRARLKAFVGGDLTDKKFDRLIKYCSPRQLRQPSDLSWSTWSSWSGSAGAPGAGRTASERRCQQRRRREPITYTRWLKYASYRSARRPLSEDNDTDPECATAEPAELPREPTLEPEVEDEPGLVPGEDLVYVFRLYVPFKSRVVGGEQRPRMARVVRLSGRRTLEALRARVCCLNDIGLRADVSARPTVEETPHARTLFPGAFLFMGGEFHLDPRGPDLTGELRRWLRPRFGEFPVTPHLDTRLDTMPVRLGYPEVMVHQGDCEHLLTLSEVLVYAGRGGGGPGTAGGVSRVRYCSACGSRAASWLVTGAERLPQDPAPVCARCLTFYFYRFDGRKIGNFKLYHFRPTDLPLLGQLY